MSASRRSSKPVYEVERKFTISPSSRTTLLSAAARAAAPIHVATFVDEYFDDTYLALTLRDLWLRKRQGEWQLKHPLPSRRPASSLGKTVYGELEGAFGVWAALETHGVVRDGLSCFANLSTTRTSFQMDFRGATIEVALDECSSSAQHREIGAHAGPFEYRVGEVEIIEECLDKVQQAEGIVDEFCDVHGLAPSCDEAPAGKLVAYLKAHRPDHYRQLVQAQIIL
jgi:CYTH domain